MNCQVIGLDCPEADLCPHCRGTGDAVPAELCANCDECFDEEVGWSTGIRPGSATQTLARRLHQPTAVYLVILEDRHADVEVEVFRNKDAALGRAREIVEEYGGEEADPPDGWLFDASLSGEGDAVRVEEAGVQ